MGLDSLEEATEDEGESSWVKLNIPCLSDCANERRLRSLGVSISAVLLPPLLPLPLPPMVDAVAEDAIVAVVAVDQAVVVGVASGGAGGRSAVATVVVDGNEGKAGDDAM